MKKQRSQVVEVVDDEDEDGEKKDKKLVFLSRSVLQKVRERPMVTGTQIANEILEMYKKFCDVSLSFYLFCTLCIPTIAKISRKLTCFSVFTELDWAEGRLQKRAA